MTTKDNIIFFYPSRIVGGAEFLFARLANYLAQNGKNVYYIDYKDGFIRKNEQYKNLKYIDFSDDEKTEIDIDGTLITPISNIYRINNYINFKNQNTKLLFWSLHPCNIIHVMPECKFLENFSANFNKTFLKRFAKNYYNVFYELLKQCDGYDCLYYMDNMNYVYNETIFPSLRSNYLPITSASKNAYTDGKIINENEINVAILGRLCIEKTQPIVSLLKALNNLKLNKKINVHIIGDGEFKKLIKPKKYEHISIIFKGTITGKDLDNYLIENADILFSMGTSCLEGAALKLPVVILPVSYSEFEFEKFSFLHETKFYNVGSWLNEYKQNANTSLNDLIDLIYNSNQKEKIGLLNYEYFYKNHSIESVVNKLLTCITKNNLNYAEYNKIKNNIPKLKKNINIVFKILKMLYKHAKK